MNRIRWYGPTIALALTVLTVAILGPHIAQRIAWAQQDAKISVIKQSLNENPALVQLSSAFRKVSQAVEPSVVFIQVSKRNTGMSGMRGGPGGPGGPDDELRRWFFGPRGPFGGPGGPGNPQTRPPQNDDGDGLDDGPGGQAPGIPGPGSPQNREDMGRYDVPSPYANGSGWVYNDKGHIITNYHVIEGADVINVRFFDGAERTATVVGKDPKTDIAVIKVDSNNLFPATIATEQAQQGDIVFAFGSPFRFEFSMSQGIVSAKGRQLGILMDRQGYENFIQTDAAINPGNSGGPLTNIYGQVIGMNTAIASRTGSFNGLGFAIPVDMVVEVADQIIAKGRVSRGYLGVYIEDLDPKMAKTFGYNGKGVLVQQPIDGGPGAKAGMQRGDIITKVNGNAVETAEALRRTIARFAPGTKVGIEIIRAGKPVNLEMTIEEQPEQVAAAGASPTTPANPEADANQILRKLGIDSATAFTKEIADQMRLRFTPGVLVRNVRTGSAAAAAGLGRGVIITEVQGVAVKSVSDLTTEMAKHDLKQGVRLTVQVRDMSRYVVLELPRD